MESNTVQSTRDDKKNIANSKSQPVKNGLDGIEDELDAIRILDGYNLAVTSSGSNQPQTRNGPRVKQANGTVSNQNTYLSFDTNVTNREYLPSR